MATKLVGYPIISTKWTQKEVVLTWHCAITDGNIPGYTTISKTAIALTASMKMTTLFFYGLRTNPATAHSDDPEKVVMVTHMEGDPAIVTLGDWLQLDLQEWEVAIATPGVNVDSTADSLRVFELRDGQGVILRNSRSKKEC